MGVGGLQKLFGVDQKFLFHKILYPLYSDKKKLNGSADQGNTLSRGAALGACGIEQGYPFTDRDCVVDLPYKPFQAPGAHVADYSKPVKTREKNRPPMNLT